jgi:hypothetical protein
MAQYDPLVIKAGTKTLLGADTLRADLTATAGLLTGTAVDPGNACQVDVALTPKKASNTVAAAIIGIYDGVSGSIVRDGVVVATMAAGVVLANGDTVYLSATAGALTNIKPTMDHLHEVGVVVNAAASKILLQPKPVIVLPATPPPYLFVPSVQADYRIRKIDTSDGSLVWNGADALPANHLNDVLYDGTFIWTLDASDRFIRKYSAATGAFVAGPFNPYTQNSCQQMAFDGVNYWSTHNSWGDSRIVKWDVAGAYVNSWVLPVAMEVPWGVCFDGDDIIYIWSLNYRRVGRFRISTSNLDAYSGGAIDGAGSTANRGVCWDGTNLWIGHDANLFKIRGADLVVLGGDTLPNTVAGICYDGTHIWAVCLNARIYKYRCSDFAAIGNYALADADTYGGVTFDGTHIWVAQNVANTVRKLVAATGAFVGDYNHGDFYWALNNTAAILPWPA